MSQLQKKYLLLKGCAGIGNRLFTLAAAISYAQETQRTLLVDWRDGVFSAPGTNAFPLFFHLKNVKDEDPAQVKLDDPELSFYPSSIKGLADKNLYDLFTPCASKTLKKIPGLSRLRGRLSRLDAFWFFSPGNNFGKQKYSDTDCLAAVGSDKHVEYGHRLPAHNTKDVVMFADYWPGDVKKKLFDHIGFSEQLLRDVSETANKIGITEQTIGVHIRHSDKKPGIELIKLFKKLEQDAASGKHVFLCTDNEDIERDLKERLGDKLILFKKFYPERSGSENMHHWSMKRGDYSQVEKIFRESLIDMLLLASCTTIYYQGNSSFSKSALMFSPENSIKLNWLNI